VQQALNAQAGKTPYDLPAALDLQKADLQAAVRALVSAVQKLQ
jgi:hypothetical protein